MTGSEKTPETSDPTKMTPMDMHAHFTKLVGDQAQDVDTRFIDVMEKIEGLEAAFNSKLDAKFQELLDRFPAPAAMPQPIGNMGRARRIPRRPIAAAPAATDAQYAEYEGEDEYDEEQEHVGEVEQPPPGRPRAYVRHGMPPRP